MDKRPDSFVLYDGGCPICSNYVAWTNLRNVRPDILLIDAREAGELVEGFRAEGIEINDNMVLKLGSLTLYGADAFSALLRLGQPKPVILKAMLICFSTPTVSRPLYPLLVLCRKILLFMLRRPPV